ncbi:hypothetical protein AB0K51_10920 [Kitasatospora sp. NPDC049285]|uniref:hypothetical protein n=1 Tax=Kitasatospora sp. NPDC049285 TaxID=3157096 RepID=UPI00343B4C8B
MSGRFGGFGGWVLAVREARTGWPVPVVLGVLSAVLAVVSLLWPPVYDGLATRELDRRLQLAQADGPLVTARATLYGPRDREGQSAAPRFGSLDEDLSRVGEGMRQGSSGELARTLVRVSGWAQSEGLELDGAGVARPRGNPGVVSLVYAQDAADRVRWVAGRAPALPGGDPRRAPLELAVSRPVSERFQLRVGQELQLAQGTVDTGAVLVGVFEPLAGSDDLWRELPLLNAPLEAATPNGFVLYGQALVAPAGLEALEARGSLSLSASWVFGTAQQPWGTGGTARGCVNCPPGRGRSWRTHPRGCAARCRIPRWAVRRGSGR